MAAISLFSGMGGDTLGMHNAGLKVVAYNEINRIFQKTHDQNFENSVLIGEDIKDIPNNTFAYYKDKIEFLFAGFSCQGFSNAGKKKVNDPRNTLFKEFVRAAEHMQPDYIIGENVKGLLSRKTTDDEYYIDVIVKSFEEIGYNVIYKVFKAHKYGIPQKRERLIILGVKSSLEREISFPEESNVLPNLKDIVKFNMKGAIKIKKKDFDMSTIPDECILKDLNNQEEENDVHPYLQVLVNDKKYTYNGTTYDNRLSFSKRISSVHGEIIDIRNPSKTIICTYEHQPRLFVPLQNKNGYYLRCLLPDELKQIQGFPSDYKINGTVKQQIIQIGNAVPPPLIKQIILHLKK